jgi:hypothetical protein
MKIEVIAYQRPDLMAYDAQMSAYIRRLGSRTVGTVEKGR